MIFEDIEDEKKKHQKLTLKEKALILIGYGIGRMILRKIRKANTYGDLNNIMDNIELSLDQADDMFDDEEKKLRFFFKDIASKLK